MGKKQQFDIYIFILYFIREQIVNYIRFTRIFNLDKSNTNYQEYKLLITLNFNKK